MVDHVFKLDVADFSPRVSIERNRRSFSFLSSPLIIVGLSKKILSDSYYQLPHQPLKLSVLKLDGSSFDIQVKNSASVAELKGAVEAVFSHMPQNGPGKISWLHVWWHFCLCYDGQKLIDDNDYIKKFGIKDGDQLQFIRHVTTGYNAVKKQSKKCILSSKLHSRSLSRSRSYEQNDQDYVGGYIYDDLESGKFQHHDNDDLIMYREPKMVLFLGGLFSHTKLASTGRVSANSLVRPSGSRPSLVRGFRNLIQLCREKNNYQNVIKKKKSIFRI